MKKIIILILLFNSIIVKAQIPINDPAWILQTALSDSFNGTSINTTKWNVINNAWDAHSLAMDYESNVVVSGGSLKLHADTLIPAIYFPNTLSIDSFRYQASTIQSNNPSFKYGYFEIRAKYPTGNLAYWPAFWLTASDCPTPSTAWYNEIDIAENGGYESLDGHIMGINWHLYDGIITDCSADNYYTTNGYNVDNLPLLSSNWHKYALQWDANSMKFFFDDSLVHTVYDPVNTPNHTMFMILDFYINPFNPLPHMPAADFEIDYFNYYKLTPDCFTDMIICVPTDYDREVKKTITTNNSCTPTFNPSTASGSYTLRATDYVLLDVGTVINPTGDGYFAVETMPCP